MDTAELTEELRQVKARLAGITINARKTAEVLLSLNRDVLWFERRMRDIARATAASPERLRHIASEALIKAKRRRARTMAKGA